MNSNGVNSGQKYELIRCKVIIVVAKGYAGKDTVLPQIFTGIW